MRVSPEFPQSRACSRPAVLALASARLLSLAGMLVCAALPAQAEPSAQGDRAGDGALEVPPVSVVNPERARRSQIREFFSTGGDTAPDSGALRRRMSREEREALRQGLNEAVRSAYGAPARSGRAD